MTVSATKVPEQKRPLTVIVGRPLLELRLTGPDKVYISQPATYEITARNTGDIPLDNVAVVFHLKNVKVVTATQGAEQLQNRLQWGISRFIPGSERKFVVKVLGTAVGDDVTIVELLSRTTTKKETKVTTFIGAAALELRVKADANPIAERERVTYAVTVRNTGTKAAEDVRLEFKFPMEQMKYLGTDARVQLAASKLADKQAESVAFSVRPRESLTLQLPFEAVVAGLATFQVQMTGPDLSAGPVTATESTTITPAPK